VEQLTSHAMDDMMLLMNQSTERERTVERMKHYPNNEKLTDAAIHSRQMSSIRVTRHRRYCDCRWCTSGPRRDGSLLIENFRYASTPTVTRIA
jgi:hypothetical protein